MPIYVIMVMKHRVKETFLWFGRCWIETFCGWKKEAFAGITRRALLMRLRTVFPNISFNLFLIAMDTKGVAGDLSEMQMKHETHEYQKLPNERFFNAPLHFHLNNAFVQRHLRELLEQFPVTTFDQLFKSWTWSVELQSLNSTHSRVVDNEIYYSLLLVTCHNIVDLLTIFQLSTTNFNLLPKCFCESNVNGWLCKLR